MKHLVLVSLAVLLACDSDPSEPTPDPNDLAGRWTLSGTAAASLPPDSMACQLWGDVTVTGTLDRFEATGIATVDRTLPNGNTKTATYTLTLEGQQAGLSHAEPTDLELVLEAADTLLLSGTWRCGTMVSHIYHNDGRVETDSAVAVGPWTLSRTP